MLEFKKILFPVDLSETSAKLVPHVTTMAEQFGSRIHLIFVARILDYFSTIHVASDSINKIEKDLVEGAERRLKEFKEEHFQAFSDLSAVVVSGDASEEILNYARSEGIDMIILGTHGRKGLDKIVFGSVAERVAKGSPVPVLLVNPHKN
ncbi:MAG: universal stress protein [Desulfobacteraceae bacterium]|nr:universal stress protein [Desulfobacteraceae bacterium]